MSYSEFVKTIFAYTYKKYANSPAPHIDMLHDLMKKHDIIHCAYGILNEYIEYANEFFKYGELLYKIDLLQTQDPSLPASSCGISKQEIAIKKEIGDIYYYKTMLHNLLDIPHNIADSEWDHQESFPIETLADFVKKFVYYAHELNIKEIQQASYDIDRCFNFVCKKLGTSLTEIIAQNEAKLRARYPSGTFTSQEAAAKADTKSE